MSKLDELKRLRESGQGGLSRKPQGVPTIPMSAIAYVVGDKPLKKARKGEPAKAAAVVVAPVLRRAIEASVASPKVGRPVRSAFITPDGKFDRPAYKRDQMRKRRTAYMARVETDKERAVAQMTFLSDQRKAAIAELLNIKENIEAAIVDVPTQIAANLTIVNAPIQSIADIHEEERPTKLTPAEEAMLDQHMASHPSRDQRILQFGEVDLPPTLPVQMIPAMPPRRPADTSSLVRRHRESAESRGTTDQSESAQIFDFEADQDF